MTTYPSALPCPLLSSSSGGSLAHTKTVGFDYSNRRVRLPKLYETQTVSFVMDDTELATFRDAFYDAIKVDQFLFWSDWDIAGNTNSEKAMKMISPPTVKALGGLRYNVSFGIEILFWGISQTRPLTIGDNLLINDYLIIG